MLKKEQNQDSFSMLNLEVTLEFSSNTNNFTYENNFDILIKKIIFEHLPYLQENFEKYDVTDLQYWTVFLGSKTITCRNETCEISSIKYPRENWRIL